MKKIYLSIWISVMFVAGCDIDRQPETLLTDSGFWQTETDLRGAGNRLYSLLTPYSNNTNSFSHDTRSDELVQTKSDAISSGNVSVPSNSENWGKPYEAIFAANNLITKSERADVSETVLNRWKAEAYFFRAFNYFLLVQKYGDVPLILKAFNDTSDPLLFSARTPREEVIQQCYDDLDFAAEWLPAISELGASDWGRVTRSAALSMKVRIGLFEGTFGKYHTLGGDYKSHLKTAIDAAELIISEGEHELYSDFQSMFLFEGEGRQNKENIFVKIYGPNGEGLITHNNSRTMENTVSVTRQMVDLFLYEDGLPREKSPLKISPETSFDDVFASRDPRLSMTLYKVGEEAYKGAYIPMANQHGFGYSLKKGFLISEWETNSKETIDKMIIRYAEILISYAEALYEYNGSITDEQLNLTINALRNRVGLNAQLTNIFASDNGLDILNEIRRERTVEFIDEGFRYNDIIRWKIAEDVLPVAILGAKFIDSETSKGREDIANRLTDANGFLNGVKVYDQADIYVIETADTRSFDAERDYLYPVPLNEISLSGGAVVQNPNW